MYLSRLRTWVIYNNEALEPKYFSGILIKRASKDKHVSNPTFCLLQNSAGSLAGLVQGCISDNFSTVDITSTQSGDIPKSSAEVANRDDADFRRILQNLGAIYLQTNWNKFQQQRKNRRMGVRTRDDRNKMRLHI